MSGGPELTQVEEPFLNQLAGMGWKIVTGNFDFPSVTGRQSFQEVAQSLLAQEPHCSEQQTPRSDRGIDHARQ